MFSFIMCLTLSDPYKYKTISGKTIMGEKISNGNAIYFESIQYAKANRFERSQSIPFSDITSKTNIPQITCPQYLSRFNFSEAEDCLYLTITIPNHHKSTDPPLPVLVFIHGGGHFIGSSIDPYISGLPFTKQGIIFISINYRLGYLGTMIHSQSKLINLQQYDQIEALRWIKTNIHEFNGNPNSVTIMGESAGANSIMMLLLSKTVKSEKLFHRAIIMSGDIANFAPNITVDDIEWYEKEIYSKRFDCDNSDKVQQWECLKTMDYREIAKFGAIRLPPTWYLMGNAKIKPMFAAEDFGSKHEIDFSIHPMDALRNGDFYKVPIIIGGNSNEGALFYKFVFPVIDANEEYVWNMLQRVFGDRFEVNEIYEIIKRNTMHGTAKEIMTEFIGMHGYYTSHLFMKWFREYGVDVYQYVWNISNEVIEDGDDYFAYHADELPHIFQTYKDFDGTELNKNHSKSTRQVTQEFVDCWISFVKTGIPCKGGGKDDIWDPQKRTFGEYLIVNENGMEVQMSWKRELIELWERLFDDGWMSNGTSIDVSEYEPFKYYLLNGVFVELLMVLKQNKLSTLIVVISVVGSCLLIAFCGCCKRKYKQD